MRDSVQVVCFMVLVFSSLALLASGAAFKSAGPAAAAIVPIMLIVFVLIDGPEKK